MLWMVTDRAGWGIRMTLVRAPTADAAAQIAIPHGSDSYDVSMVLDKLASGILWSHEDSPDSPRE